MNDGQKGGTAADARLPGTVPQEGFTARRQSRGAASVGLDLTLPPGPPDGEISRLTREDWKIRAELTTVVNEIRALERRARTSPLPPADAKRMRTLRSRESELHSAMARGAAALRDVRSTAAGGSA